MAVASPPLPSSSPNAFRRTMRYSSFSTSSFSFSSSPCSTSWSSSSETPSHLLWYGAAAFVALSSTGATLISSSSPSSSSSSTTCSSCESPPSSSSSSSSFSPNGPADETEDAHDDDGGNEIVRDGMDAGGKPKESSRDPIVGAAEADEYDDDDDPSKDEETSCSICLINRQGPCRKYWVKFERCMKDHGVEKERRRREKEEQEDEATASANAKAESEAEGKEEGHAIAAVSMESLQAEWDDFMEKSTRPGEEDDEDEEGEEDEEEDDEEEEEEDSDKQQSTLSDQEAEEGETLAARCDKYMLPWISCIQQHRNVYSLISNEFYQKDYVDPLEDTVPDDKRQPFAELPLETDDEDGATAAAAAAVSSIAPLEFQEGMPYSVRFRGVEVDLESWREYIEADADDNGGDDLDENKESSYSSASEREPQPRLVNAYAKFKLIEPDRKRRPIEVAYVKDQKGRLLGFDSFSKREAGGASSDDIENDDHDDDDGAGDSANGIRDDDDASGDDSQRASDGECTFHLVPGETTSVRAYAIYRGVTNAGGDGEEKREDVMYYTPEILLPGVDARSKSD
ncbi:hypothetical protein ACHAXS_001926 [Conticribra weissflogii]